MNGFFKKTISRKALALIMVIALTVCTAFAAPLQSSGETGDAKVYDSNYKATGNVSAISDGWVVMTGWSEITLQNSDLSLTIGAGSLLRIISVENGKPEIYILDGSVEAESTVDLAIRTTVTSYDVPAGTALTVVTNSTAEQAYVEKGTVMVTNRITNAVTELAAERYIDNSLSGFQPAATTREVFRTLVFKARATQAPAEEAPALEPEVTETEASSPAAGPLVHTFTFMSYEATITAYVGTAYIEYPSFVTADEINAAALAAFTKYSALCDGIFYTVKEAGLVEVTYPESYGPAEFDYACQLIGYELPLYINELFGLVAEPATSEEPAAAPEPEQAPVAEAEPVQEEETAEPAVTETSAPEVPAMEEIPAVEDAPAAEAEPQEIETASEDTQAVAKEETATEEPAMAEIPSGTPLTYTFDVYSYKLTLTGYVGKGYLVYPSFVTTEEVNAAALAAFTKYSTLCDGIFYTVKEAGLVEVTYPESYGPAEFDYACKLIEYELPLYVNEIFGLTAGPAAAVPSASEVVAVLEPAVETAPEAEPEAAPEAEAAPAEAAAEVAEAAVTETAAPAPEVTEPEAAVEEAPAAEEPKQDTLKTSIPTVSRTEATAAKEAEPGFRFGADIAVTYGAGSGTAEYKGFGTRQWVGSYYKSVGITLDPYIATRNFQFGLHLGIDPFNIMDSFSFITDKGITGYVNSVMKYVSKFSFRTDNGVFSINADRTGEAGFTSPVFGSLDKAFDSSDRLAATMDITAKHFVFNAFVDDISLQGKLEGKDQFAGARAGVSFNHIQAGFSILSNVSAGLSRNMKIFPAVDVSVPFTLGGLGVTLSADAALQTTVGNVIDMQKLLDNCLVSGKIDVEYKAFSFGFGAAYSQGRRFYASINNAPAKVTSPFNGTSVDVLLSLGIDTSHFKLSADINAPLALTGGSRLVRNTVTTVSGNTASLTADVFTLRADLILGKFTFSAGTIYNGLCGKLADVARSFITGNGRKTAVLGLIDPETCTYYAIADFNFGVVDVYGRLDYEKVNGTHSLPVSAGVKISF